jgi:asparagine synthase (glutamine-hydrolysing)
MPSDRAEAITGVFGHRDLIEQSLESMEGKVKQLPILSQMTVAELSGFTLNVLLKDSDQFSMTHALEVREPFFDYRLIEYVLRIPDKIKYPRYSKSLLVEALAPRLPDEIVHRPKMGFVVPYEEWMRGPLRSFCQDRLNGLIERGVTEKDATSKLWSSFLNRSNGVLWSHLWHLVVLSDWLDRHEFK